MLGDQGWIVIPTAQLGNFPLAVPSCLVQGQRVTSVHSDLSLPGVCNERSVPERRVLGSKWLA